MRSIAGERRAAHKAELILVTGNHYQVRFQVKNSTRV
jgi:hypothetical protein